MLQKFGEHFNNHVGKMTVHQIDHVDFIEPPIAKMPVRPFDAKFGAVKFEKSIPFLESKKAQKETEEKETLESIKHIFKSGNSHEITDFLDAKNDESLIFSKEISRVRREHEQKLDQANFLTENDWKILTAIELCDQKTFEHSVGTFLVARKKIEDRLPELKNEIVHEGISLDNLYRACLFHDIGKITIPEFIVNNETTFEQWIFYFIELSEEEQDQILLNDKLSIEDVPIIPDSIRHDLGAMTDFFKENKLRPTKLFPISSCLKESEIELLSQYGFDPDSTLSEIMQIHEKKSEEILSKLNYIVEALLAGNHHNYKHKRKEHPATPISLSALHISIEFASNIIHLADMQQALSEKRSYLGKQDMIHILDLLVDDAKDGVIDPKLTARWIEDELKILEQKNPHYLAELRNMISKKQHHDHLQKCHEEILRIDAFVGKNL